MISTTGSSGSTRDSVFFSLSDMMSDMHKRLEKVEFELRTFGMGMPQRLDRLSNRLSEQEAELAILQSEFAAMRQDTLKNERRLATLAKMMSENGSNLSKIESQTGTIQQELHIRHAGLRACESRPPSRLVWGRWATAICQAV